MCRECHSDRHDDIFLWKDSFPICVSTSILELPKQLQAISQDKQKRLEYEARLKTALDYNQSIYEAELRGIRQGIAKEQKIQNRNGKERKSRSTNQRTEANVKKTNHIWR